MVAPLEEGIRERDAPSQQERNYPGVLNETGGQLDHENFLLESGSQPLQKCVQGGKSLVLKQKVMGDLHMVALS